MIHLQINKIPITTSLLRGRSGWNHAMLSFLTRDSGPSARLPIRLHNNILISRSATRWLFSVVIGRNCSRESLQTAVQPPLTQQLASPRISPSYVVADLCSLIVISINWSIAIHFTAKSLSRSRMLYRHFSSTISQ